MGVSPPPILTARLRPAALYLFAPLTSRSALSPPGSQRVFSKWKTSAPISPPPPMTNGWVKGGSSFYRAQAPDRPGIYRLISCPVLSVNMLITPFCVSDRNNSMKKSTAGEGEATGRLPGRSSSALSLLAVPPRLLSPSPPSLGLSLFPLPGMFFFCPASSVAQAQPPLGSPPRSSFQCSRTWSSGLGLHLPPENFLSWIVLVSRICPNRELWIHVACH